tara:strand:- start:56 stop:406 length:351 start_codon:yes stop_codon:yes gene_type:complete
MKEYRLLEISENDSELSLRNHYLLIPLMKADHAIAFTSKSEAHQAKLSLGLGKIPCPDKAPQNYRVTNSKYQNLTVYFMIQETTLEEDDDLDGCCFSGCSGCPTYERAMKNELGKN